MNQIIFGDCPQTMQILKGGISTKHPFLDERQWIHLKFLCEVI